MKKHIYTLFFTILLPLLSIAQFDIQSFIDHLDTIQNPNKKASSYLFVSEYFILEKPNEAKIFAELALALSKKQNDSLLISDSYKYLGISYAELRKCHKSDSLFKAGIPFIKTPLKRAKYYTDMGAAYGICGNLSNAQKYYRKAKSLLEETDNKEILRSLLINMGVGYSRTSQYYKASKAYHEALELSEMMNDSFSIAIIYQNMGEVMALQSQYDKAVGYFNSALNMYIDQDRQKAMAGTYLNLGQLYIELEQWDIAKSYLNKSYIIDTTLNLINYESSALKQLGITYLRTNKLESAEKLIKAALYLQEKNDFKTLIPETQITLAEVYYKQGKIDKANELLEIAQNVAIQLNDDLLLANTLHLKAQVLQKKNQHKTALKLLFQSNKISDSIFNLEKTNSIMNLELAYETELKEKQIDELKYNHSLQKQKIKNKSSQIYLLIVSLVLLVFILLFMYIYLKKRRQIENQQQQQKFLQGKFDAEEKAKDKIARELHDDIGGQMIGLIMQLQSNNKLNDKEFAQLQKIYLEIRRLSHNLDEPIFKNLTLQEKLKNYFSEMKQQLEFKISFIDDIDINWKTIKENQEIQRNIYRIIQELITNTAKYASATEVEIQLISDKNTISLLYEDNGIGMQLENKNTKDQFNTIKKRLEMFHGKMDVQSEPDKGVFISIFIPYKM